MLLPGEDYFSSINVSTSGTSAGAQTNEDRFSLFSQISLECSAGFGIPPTILHLMQIPRDMSWSGLE
jgi:hypothetical protein